MNLKLLFRNIHFPINLKIAANGFSCPAVPTYILRAKERGKGEKFEVDSFNIERLVGLEVSATFYEYIPVHSFYE